MSRSSIRLILVSIAAVTALIAVPVREGRAGEQAPDAVVLESGERLLCKIQRVTRGRVHVEIGGQPYELESNTLARIEPAGQRPISPAAVAFIRDLVMKLGSSSPEVVEASTAALRVLAKTHAPVLRSLSRRIRDETMRGLVVEIAKSAENMAAESTSAEKSQDAPNTEPTDSKK